MGGGDTIQIGTGIDLSGFKKGSQKLMSAVSSLGKRIDSIGKTVSKSTSQMVRGFSSMAAPIKRIIPMILGVGSAYQVISKSVNAFMQQNEELSSKMNSIWTALGNVLGPIITQIINWVTTAVSYFLEFLRLLGITSKSASQLSKNAKAAGSEMKKQLAGFDELNILNDSGGGGGANGTLEDKEAPQWIKDIADFLKKKEWERAGEVLAAKMNEIVNSVKWSEIGERIGEGFDGAIRFLYAAIRNFDWTNLGKRFSEAINGFIKKVNWNTFGRLIVQKIIVPIKLLYGFITGLDTKKLGEGLSDVILGALQEIKKALEEFDPALMAEKIIGFFSGIKVDEIAEEFKNVLVLAINKGLIFFRNLRTGISWEETGAKISSKISEIIQDIPWGDIGEELGKWFVSIIQGLTGFINGISDEDITNITNAIKAFFEKIPWGEIGDSILVLLGDALKLALKLVWNILGLDDVETLNGAINSITEAIDGLRKLFSGGGGTWVESLKGIWDVIKEMITATVGTAADVIPHFVEQFASGLGDFPDSLYSLFNTLKKLWNEAILPMITAVDSSGVVESLFSILSSCFKILVDTVGPVVDGLVKLVNEVLVPLIKIGGELAGLVATITKVLAHHEMIEAIENGEEGAMQAWDEMFRYLGATADEKMDAIAKSVTNAIFTIGESAKGLNFSFGEGGFSYTGSDGGSRTNEVADRIVSNVNDYYDALTKLSEGSEVAVGANLALGQSFAELINQYMQTGDSAEMMQELYEATAEYFAALVRGADDPAKMVESILNQSLATQEVIDLMREYGVIIDETGVTIDGIAQKTTEMAEGVNEAAEGEQSAAEAVANAKSEMDEMPDSSVEAGKAQEDLGKTAGEAGDTVVTESEEMSEKTVSSYDDIVAAAEETNKTVNAEFTELGEGIAKSMEENMAGMRSDFAEGTSDLARTVGEETTEAVTVFDHNMGIMSDHAYRWGKDMMGQLASGINEGFILWVGPMMFEVAKGIAAYIHHSTPDIGPLANDDEFMPDMMKLLAKGIEDNIPLAKNAASGIAEAISGEITDGDYALGDDAFSGLESLVNSMSGNAGLVSSLSAIADRVAYQMPVVAGGNFLPYSVGTSGGYEAASGQSSSIFDGEITEVIGLLRSIHSAILEGKIIAIDRTQFAEVLVRTLENEARMRGKDIL